MPSPTLVQTRTARMLQAIVLAAPTGFPTILGTSQTDPARLSLQAD